MNSRKIGVRNLFNKKLRVLLSNWEDIFKIRTSSVRKA